MRVIEHKNMAGSLFFTVSLSEGEASRLVGQAAYFDTTPAAILGERLQGVILDRVPRKKPVVPKPKRSMVQAMAGALGKWKLPHGGRRDNRTKTAKDVLITRDER